MNSFTNIVRRGHVSESQRRRISQRDFFPQTVKGRQIPQDMMGNSEVERLSVAVNNVVSFTITSTVTAADFADKRVGVLPYMIALYQTSATTANQIPFGSSIAYDDYVIDGPFAMPQVTDIGTDGNNVVIKTFVTNTSGSNQTVVIDIQTRTIIAGGGGT